MLHLGLDQSSSFEDYCTAEFAIKVWRSLLWAEVYFEQPFNSRKCIKYNQDIDVATVKLRPLAKGQNEEDRQKSTQCLYCVLQPVNLIRKFLALIRCYPTILDHVAEEAQRRGQPFRWRTLGDEVSNVID